MTRHPDSAADRDAIEATLQHYVDGARSGSGDRMKPAFHSSATIFGFVGEDLFGGGIQKLFDWNDANGPAVDIRARITNVDVAGSVATARLEIDDWTGHRFTDLFTLLKTDGHWRIVNKVFHLHPADLAPQSEGDTHALREHQSDP